MLFAVSADEFVDCYQAGVTLRHDGVALHLGLVVKLGGDFAGRMLCDEFVDCLQSGGVEDVLVRHDCFI